MVLVYTFWSELDILLKLIEEMLQMFHTYDYARTLSIYFKGI